MQASDELQWLASCYVLSELSPEEQQHFEDRLATDELAQQAVVDATRLLVLCSAVEESPSLVAPPTPDRGAAEGTSRAGVSSPKFSRWIPLSLAASLLLTLGLVGIIQQSRPDDSPATAYPRSVASDLVRLWRDSPSEFETSAISSFSPSAPENEDADDVADDLEIPSWIMAAVSDDRESPGDDPQEVWAQ